VAAELADLQDRLQNGLRTRAPADIAFIKQVVALVKTGKLTVNDVLGVYRWAEPKRPHPFPYFREAMRRVARRQGINL
jgi:hypothetical protein